jgi:hypothetical protein
LTTRSGAVSDHDRSTARDELEALVITEGDEPGQ